jgi:3-isopropylmalate/(R)-2-methylmalate dehydratase small subunit
VAKSFARIFLQNGINLGLRMLVCPDLAAEEGDELELRPDRVVNQTSGKEFALLPMPRSRQAIIDAGGLIPYTRQRLQQPSRSESRG